MKFLLNTTIFATSANKLSCKLEKISLQEARAFVSSSEFTSAIGHESTAELLTQLLDVQVDANRINVDFNEGDEALCFKTRFRAEEGKIYSLSELKQIEFDFFVMRFFSLKRLLDDIAGTYQHGVPYTEFEYADIIKKGEYGL